MEFGRAFSVPTLAECEDVGHGEGKPSSDLPLLDNPDYAGLTALPCPSSL